MRIILVQAEIELAIRAYVLTQISVKEGQEVTIDFKNTRGEDGATAEINITSPSLASVENAQRPSQSPSLVQTTQTAPKETKPSPAPVVAPTAVTTAPVEQLAPAAFISTGEERVDPSVNQEEEAPAIQAAEAEEGQDEQMPDPVTKPVAVEDAAPAPKSLFANLTKPVNPKT